MKCNVCSRRFELNKRNKYMVEKNEGLLASVFSKKVYEAFDCPKCGCQNIVNIRETMLYGEKIICGEEADGEE